MGTVINIDQAPIDDQPDTANTIGSTLLNDLGTAGVVLATAGASRIAGNGRMPYDPADPNFGAAVIKVQNAQGSVSFANSGGSMSGQGSGGLLLLIFILWLIFRKKPASA